MKGDEYKIKSVDRTEAVWCISGLVAKTRAVWYTLVNPKGEALWQSISALNH